ncbi:hypothetical protein PAXRUDRAFT_515677 [Paxillus rubicundulus Ve08.2h10]|uniref:Uncharacterized protein n=1 Tax=Paxillus rubicundulus Ve08.2h10 TaxID=930991 RepID=A0A0D0DNM0_9AGAM|nr:hypothetical protein PAXRUDRAFT_515677 [Paxillus rubicundulus Ve08.2h10]
MNVTVFGNVTTAPNSFSSSSIPAGTIAALVLAAILCLVILGALYYVSFVRRKARPVKKRAVLHHSQTSNDEKVDPNIERVIDISPPPGEEDLESNSLSTNKGYGFGLGMRRGFPFAYRKGKTGSSSSGKSPNGSGVQTESHPMIPQYDHDDKRFSINTLTADLPVLPHAPESEKLAPGWSNPIARTSFASKNSYAGLGQHGFLLPELLVEMDEALAATLTLCPRTSEAPAGFGTAILGVDGQDYTRQPRQPQQNSHVLEVRETSPFRVDVAAIFGTLKGNRDSRGTSGSRSSTWSKVRARLYRRAHRDDGRQSYRMDRQETSSSSGPESVPVVLLESGSGVPPSETAPASGTYSFLDLTSPHASFRRHSKTTTLSSTPADVGHEHRATSSWSDNTSVRMVRIERSRDDIAAPKPDAPSTVSRGSHPDTPSDNSNGYTQPSAPTIHTHGSSPFPFPVTIPPSTHMPHPFNVVPGRHTSPSPPPPVPSHMSHQFLQVRQFSPHEPISPVNSLAESVPFSVSDIHFRHSFSDYAGVDSRRTSTASTLPPHPPLPHHGSQSSTPAYSPPPPYVVQRVLGLPMTPLISPSRVVRADTPPATMATTAQVSSTGRPLGSAVSPTLQPTSQFRIGSLLGPRPRPPRPRPSTTGSARGTAAPQLPMQGGRANLRTNQR